MASDENQVHGPPKPRLAPGGPGEPARWATGSKTAGGTSRSSGGHIWFTVAHGILTECFYPRIDSPCTRDLRLIVTGPGGFYSDESEDAEHRVEWLAEGVPGYRITNTCRRGHYRIEKTVITDSTLHVIYQRTRFEALRGSAADYRVHAILNPHVGGKGDGNNGWVGRFKGRRMLIGQRGDLAVALACSRPATNASAGFVGKSDGRDDLRRVGHLETTYDRAEDGNVALVAEVDLTGGGEFLLTLGFGLGGAEAAHNALAGLQADFDEVRERYADEWSRWQGQARPLEGVIPGGRDLYRASLAILRSHANKSIPGAVAGMAIPWGDHRGDDDLKQGAYHLVWARDMAQQGGGLLAAGSSAEIPIMLDYLRSTQEAEGGWPQNMWVSGEPFWAAVQLDQAALPILLADLALREGTLSDRSRGRIAPMIRRAAGFLAARGPATEQDRWEDVPGYNAFTLATIIAALLAAADWADADGRGADAEGLRRTADDWESRIEGWLYVRGTPLAKRLGIDGYYARSFPAEAIEPPRPRQDAVRFRGPEPEADGIPLSEVVSVDPLALVRFGLRRPDDPRIASTVKAIDALLKVETPAGPTWHRYVGDKFGEQDDGSPYSEGKGVGRAWPLLAGERAHYELAAGRRDAAEALGRAMAGFAAPSGTIPEQVWDAPNLPDRDLFLGRPTGSVMPLLWAHAEYVKLLRSLREGRVFDLPPQAAARYARGER